MRGDVQPPQADLQVLLVDFDSDKHPSQFVRDKTRRERAREGVEHEVARIRASLYDSLQQCDWLLGRVLLILWHPVTDARNLPHVARHFGGIVNAGDWLPVINQLALRP